MDKFKKIKSGNIKQALRRVKMAVPLTKVMNFNDDLRE